MRYVVGIDGGGTTCRAALADRQGRILGRATSGPANIRTDLQGAYNNIMAALTEAAAQAGISPGEARNAIAVLGLAGSNAGSYAARLRALLAFRDTIIVNDSIIALHGALGPYDGVIGIVGTGSVFASRRGTQTRMIGGWGFQIGDLGGGARLGRQLLEETLLAFDGVRPATSLTENLLAMFDGDPSVIVERVRDAPPSVYGEFVSLLVEAAAMQDPVATGILDAGCRDIERMFDAMIDPETDRICLLGGLAATYATRLGVRYRNLLTPPLGDALDGAIGIAAARAEALEGAADG